MVCSQCTSEKIKHSRMQAGDFLPRLLLLTPMRCHTCNHRFYVPLPLLLWKRWVRKHDEQAKGAGTRTA